MTSISNRKPTRHFASLCIYEEDNTLIALSHELTLSHYVNRLCYIYQRFQLYPSNPASSGFWGHFIAYLKLRSHMMEKAVNPYSAFDINTAGEPFNTSSSENSHGIRKSRRLTMEQTRALEKSFELAKILEDGRKEELAETLGLNPRQISIWFQNRRVKWKTAQLEKDFGVLKQSYESLEGHYHTLREENRKLQSEIQRLRSILKKVENKKEKEVTGDRQIDFNIVQDKKEGCYGVHNTEDNNPHQATMEENCRQNFLLPLQEEDCHYNMDEISGIMSVPSMDSEFLLE